jgi:hypothetical protein
MATPEKLEKWKPSTANQELILTSEPTLDALANDIRRLHDIHFQFVDGSILTLYIGGLCLIEASTKIKKAPRGVHGVAQEGDGFQAWKRKNFPGRSLEMLRLQTQFAEEVAARLAEREKGKNPTKSGFYFARFETFQRAISQEDLAELLRLLGEVMEGKKWTAWLRMIGRMRQPQIGAGGHRIGPRGKRTNEKIEEAERKKAAAVAYKELSGQLQVWDEERHFIFLEDLPLQELREAVDDLHHALSSLAKDRKLPRLPENWRQSTHHA